MLSAAQLRAQRDILISFYRATGGEQWKRKDNWDDESKPVSSFHGVTVDATTGAVIEIKISSNGVSGTTTWQNSSLNRLYVSHTHHHPLILCHSSYWLAPEPDLSGSIPVELGNLTSLTDLRLFYNKLSGEEGNLAIVWEICAAK